MRRFLFLLVIGCIVQSCHYIPFLKYGGTRGDDNFPKFKDKHYFAGSPHHLRSAYDITCYDWTVSVNPKRKHLDGTMIIHFRAQDSRDTILIDLQSKLKVDRLTGTIPVLKHRHKGDLLFVIFEKKLVPGELYSVTIDYSGKPASVIGMGPVVWSEDETGKPWVSTITQGIGPHFMMPCKDLLDDEPDSLFIRVEVPADLLAIANGKLLKTELRDKKRTFHWFVDNPINVYNISFNVGNYVRFEYPYTDLMGQMREIEAYVLEEDSAVGKSFYAQTPAVMRELEVLFGPFPWWNDGCRFLQTAIKSGAMEHQSAISMGSILENDWQVDSVLHTNSTLIHELAHEWWGNSITARDYGDAWLHEGMASYCEALIAERLYGDWAYAYAINQMVGRIDNERPIIKPFGVRYNSWVSRKDGDIYNKGALFMHSLRMQIDDDSIFFQTYKEAYEKFQLSQISSADLQDFFIEKTNMDLKPLFDAYLRQADAPTLSYYFDESRETFHYKWLRPLPEGFNIKVKIGIGDGAVELYPGDVYQTVPMSADVDRTLPRATFAYIEIKKDEDLEHQLMPK